MPGVNGRIAKLEKAAGQALDKPPGPDIDGIYRAYLDRLREVLLNVSPDTLEQVEEVTRELGHPLTDDDLRAFVDNHGALYWWWREQRPTRNGPTYDCYRLPVVVPDDMTGAYLWILAEIVRHGVSFLIVADDQVRRPVPCRWEQDKPKWDVAYGLRALVEYIEEN